MRKTLPVRSQYISTDSLTKFKVDITNSPPLRSMCEAIRRNQFDLLSACTPFDNSQTLTLDPSLFKIILKKHLPDFTSHDLNELLDVSPKNEDGKVMYNEMVLMIDVIQLNNIDILRKRQTIFTKKDNAT